MDCGLQSCIITTNVLKISIKFKKKLDCEWTYSVVKKIRQLPDVYVIIYKYSLATSASCDYHCDFCQHKSRNWTPAPPDIPIY